MNTIRKRKFFRRRDLDRLISRIEKPPSTKFLAKSPGAVCENKKKTRKQTNTQLLLGQ